MSKSQFYPESYKAEVYLQWYNAGKPPASSFILEIMKTDDGRTPNIHTLQQWMIRWREDSKALDERVYNEVLENTIESKVKMIQVQLGEARDLRVMAYQTLLDSLGDLTPSVATRLWLESANLERQLSGIPEALEKMANVSDEDLLEELADQLTSGDIEILDANSE